MQLKYLAILIAILFTANIFADNKLYLLYDKYPKKVYKNQVFKIKLKLLVSNLKFDDIKIEFEDSKNIKILNKDEEWVWESNNVFFNTYYISLLSKYASLPKMKVSVVSYEDINATSIDDNEEINATSIDNDEDIEEVIAQEEDESDQDMEENSIENIDGEQVLKPQKKQVIIAGSTFLNKKKIKVFSIKWNKNYSSVIAKDFKINDYQVEQYDKNTNIIAIEIEAKEANLYDFEISNPDIIKQKIDIKEIQMPHSNIIYHAIINKNLKQFKFNYFLPSKSAFKYESLPILLEQETISTQTDINPKNNNFETLKIIFVAIIILIFTALLVFRKRPIYIIGVLIFGGILINIIMPLEKAILPKGAKIKILPIKKSTIFLILKQDIKAEVVKYQNGFAKVIFNNKIGWVDEKSIEEN